MTEEQYAVFAGHVLAVDVLSKRLAELTGQDAGDIGRSAIHEGCQNFKKMGPIELVSILQRLQPTEATNG